MNTQTHLLMAAAVALPWVEQRATPGTVSPSLLLCAALLGAVLPDVSLIAMVAVGVAMQVPASVIFDEWYFNDFWQGIGAMSNSIPIYVVLAAVSGLSLYRVESKRSDAFFASLLVLSLSALMHCLTDFPLHHDDGRPHFWPLTQWVYESPVSYWDPRHYGQLWSVFEVLLATGFAYLLWRRYRGKIARLVVVVTTASLLALTSVWGWVFG